MPKPLNIFGTSKTTFPKRGEVWYVELPNEPDDPHQPRTAIIISRNGRNEKSSTVMIVPTSGSLAIYDTKVLIPAGEGGLKKASAAMCDRLCTLDKRFLKSSGPLGAPIAKTYLDLMVTAVRRSIGDLSGY